jgi:ubiquitin carboxyl-terminal hydrolase 25
VKAGAAVKSNEPVKVPERLHLQRYRPEHRSKRLEKIKERQVFQEQVQKLEHAMTEKFTDEHNRKSKLANLEETLEQIKQASGGSASEETDMIIAQISSTIDSLKQEMQEAQLEINALHKNIHALFDDLKEETYSLHAVFIHEGLASFGHYWVYLKDRKSRKWYKYNDSVVKKVALNPSVTL